MHSISPPFKKLVLQDYSHKDNIVLNDNLNHEPHKPYSLPTSVTRMQMLHKYWHPHHSDYRNMIYKDTSSHTVPLCDISLGSLTLYMPGAGDFVELFLLCLSNSFSWSRTLSHYSFPSFTSQPNMKIQFFLLLQLWTSNSAPNFISCNTAHYCIFYCQHIQISYYNKGFPMLLAWPSLSI
jgi:hypothetical protein